MTILEIVDSIDTRIKKSENTLTAMLALSVLTLAVVLYIASRRK